MLAAARRATASAARGAWRAAGAARMSGGLDSALFTPSEEHAALRSMVRRFAEEEVEPQAADFNRAEKLNVPLLRRVGELGLLGVTVAPEYGGSGMDATAAVIVHEELSASDPAFCLAYLAHSMLFANNLAVNGSEDQKRRLLPGACDGSVIGGMGMSEPGGGTDVLGMRTTAVRDGDAYVLNGSKMWITNASVGGQEMGDAFLVYARTSDAPGGRSISMFLVEKGMPGFRLGQVIRDKLGMRASTTAELVLEDVRVPAANLVGDEGGAVLCMMRNLELERLTLAAMSQGIAMRCVNVMSKYAEERQAFGEPLSRFGQVQRHIAESYAEMMAGRAYAYFVASQLRLGEAGGRVDSDGTKLFSSTMAKHVADRAIQVLGGYGYVGEYVVERLWRDAKLLEIGGGTVEAHHKNMTRDIARWDRVC